MTELNNSTFKDTINSEALSAVDFWAEWCMPCKVFTPVLEELSDELDGKINFYKVNIDDCMELAQEYSVASIPTVILFKNGEAVERMVGVKPKQEVLEILEKHL